MLWAQDFDFSLTFPKLRCCGIAVAVGSRNRGCSGQVHCETRFLSSLLQICVHIAISERLQTAERNKIFQPGCSAPKACLFFPILIFYSYTYHIYFFLQSFGGKLLWPFNLFMEVAENKCSPRLELGCAHLLVSTLRTRDRLDNIICMQCPLAAV